MLLMLWTTQNINDKDDPNKPQFLPIFNYIAVAKMIAVSCFLVSVHDQ